MECGVQTLQCADVSYLTSDFCCLAAGVAVTSYTFIENEGNGMVTVMGPVDFPGTLSVAYFGFLRNPDFPCHG